MICVFMYLIMQHPPQMLALTDVCSVVEQDPWKPLSSLSNITWFPPKNPYLGTGNSQGTTTLSHLSDTEEPELPHPLPVLLCASAPCGSFLRTTAPSLVARHSILGWAPTSPSSAERSLCNSPVCPQTLSSLLNTENLCSCVYSPTLF